MPTAAYIGTVAHPVPIEWIDGVRVSRESRYSLQEAAARTWAFASRPSGSPSPRTWEVTARVGSATMSNLEGLAMGAFGNGPFLWLPESAYITNAITPRQSLLLDGAGAGADAAGGRAPRSVVGPRTASLATGVPVMPGSPCTISVDASGSTTLRAIFRTAAGGTVLNTTQTATGSLMQRISITVPNVPAAARTVEVQVANHTIATRPQVTWLRHEIPWAPGAGADSVILERFENSTMHLDQSELMMSVVMTLREVS